MTAIRALLKNMFDYAGTAPPASLSMSAACQNYATYLAGPNAWMLGRFILPLAALEELENCLKAGPAPAHPWQVSVTAAPGNELNIARILAFNQRWSDANVRIDTVEIKIVSAEQVGTTRKSLPDGLTFYCEISPMQSSDEILGALKTANARAKIRTGGLEAALFPSSGDVASFLKRCADARVGFKATAGLHHPLRSIQNLTADPSSPKALMYGFVNVFLGAALAFRGASEDAISATLEERLPHAFRFDQDCARWHDHRLTSEELASIRTSFAFGLGSCSFEEPLNDLRGVGWL
jgi:hypothetical protein